MLRLQLSEITLTHGEVDDLKRRLHLQRARASVQLMNFTHPSHQNLTNTLLPRIRRGPERSRDESLTDSSLLASLPSTASSDIDYQSDGSRGFLQPAQSNTSGNSPTALSDGPSQLVDTLPELPEQGKIVTRDLKDNAYPNSDSIDADDKAGDSGLVPSTNTTCMLDFDPTYDGALSEASIVPHDQQRERTEIQADELFRREAKSR